MDDPKIKKVGVIEGYDQWVKTYDSEDNPLIFLVEENLGELLGAVKGQKIIELGCGTGRNLVQILNLGAQFVLGFDISDGMLARARAKLNPKFSKLLLQDMQSTWPVQDESFDVVLESLALEHLANVDFFFQEAHRVLKPGGKALLFEIHPIFHRQGKAAHYDDENGTKSQLPSFHHSVEDYHQSAIQAGLKLENLWEFNGREQSKSAKLELYKDTPVLISLLLKKDNRNS
ncbi:MAG: class I SAM-dependent methyltransferase [Oligoflexia bacterium]|nr:class I SAM-dependent methyltransferase [Oligoflexia bacterium]